MLVEIDCLPTREDFWGHFGISTSFPINPRHRLGLVYEPVDREWGVVFIWRDLDGVGSVFCLDDLVGALCRICHCGRLSSIGETIVLGGGRLAPENGPTSDEKRLSCKCCRSPNEGLS